MEIMFQIAIYVLFSLISQCYFFLICNILFYGSKSSFTYRYLL